MIVKAINNTAFASTTVLLLLFINTSNAATQTHYEGIIAESSIEDYVGSKACAECHQDKYEDWSGKHMSDFVRYRRDISGPLQGNWSNSPIDKDEVFIIIGNKKKAAFADKNWRLFPYQYHFKKREWQKRKKWANEDYRLRCAPCHTVGLNPSTKQFVEINVGCESCHGPGSMHTDTPEEKKMKVPGITDEDNVLFTCRRCHNERRNHARAIEEFSGIFHSKGE